MHGDTTGWILLYNICTIDITKACTRLTFLPGQAWHLSLPYRATPLRAIDQKRWNPNDAQCTG
jgi:hypothetical protein